MILVVNNMGQLGNRLVLFAHCLATALRTKQSICFVFGADIRETTGLRKKSVNGIVVRCLGFSCRKLVSRILFALKVCFRYQPFSDLNRKRYVENMPTRLKRFSEHPNGINPVLVWDFSNPTDVIQFRPDIVACLDFLPQFKARPDSWVADIRNSHEVLVGVHLRKGDYKRFHGGRFFFSDTQFARFMRTFSTTCHKRIAFILVSNEPIHLDGFPPGMIGGDAFNMADNNPQEDMYLLSLCDFIMGPPSTFSWWAAYYGGKPYLVIRSQEDKPENCSFRQIAGLEYRPIH